MEDATSMRVALLMVLPVTPANATRDSRVADRIVPPSTHVLTTLMAVIWKSPIVSSLLQANISVFANILMKRHPMDLLASRSTCVNGSLLDIVTIFRVISHAQ